VKSIRIEVANPPHTLDLLDKRLQTAGVTVALLKRSIMDVLDYESRLAIDPQSPYTLSIRVATTPSEVRGTRPLLAIWANLRVLTWTERGTGPHGTQRVPLVLYDSQSVWTTSRKTLRKDVLDSVRSHTRALVSYWVSAQAERNR
jgi:hypothetical protein